MYLLMLERASRSNFIIMYEHDLQCISLRKYVHVLEPALRLAAAHRLMSRLIRTGHLAASQIG